MTSLFEHVKEQLKTLNPIFESLVREPDERFIPGRSPFDHHPNVMLRHPTNASGLEHYDHPFQATHKIKFHGNQSNFRDYFGQNPDQLQGQSLSNKAQAMQDNGNMIMRVYPTKPVVRFGKRFGLTQDEVYPEDPTTGKAQHEILFRRFINVKNPSDHIMVPDEADVKKAGEFGRYAQEYFEKEFPQASKGVYRERSVSHDDIDEFMQSNKVKTFVDPTENRMFHGSETKKVNENEIDTFKELHHEDPRVRANVFRPRNINLMSHEIDQGLNDKSWVVRSKAASHQMTRGIHIDKMLHNQETFKDERDPDNYKVRLALLRNPNLQRGHLEKLINDNNPIVRREANQHPRFQEWFGNQ